MNLSKILIAIFICTLLFPCLAHAQINNGGSGGGGSTSPGGTPGQIQYNSAGSFGGFTVSGDGTINTSTGVMINTGINGTPVTTSLATGALTITSAATSAFAVGPNGTTNPAFNINSSTASSATGITLTSAAAGSGVSFSATSSAPNENVALNSKGAGDIILSIPTPSSNPRIRFNFNNGSSIWQFGEASGVYAPLAGNQAPKFSFTAPADTSIPASQEAPEFNWTGNTRQWATGTLTIQEDYKFAANTISFAGASTVGEAATVSILGAPIAGTNATIPQTEALRVNGGAAGANTTTAYSLVVKNPTGATNNFSSNFNGDVTFTGSAPTVSSCGGGTLVTGSTDHKGQITGITAATSCTITFSQPLGTAPSCTHSSSTGIAVGSTVTTSADVTTMASLTGTLYYICF